MLYKNKSIGFRNPKLVREKKVIRKYLEATLKNYIHRVEEFRINNKNLIEKDVTKHLKCFAGLLNNEKNSDYLDALVDNAVILDVQDNNIFMDVYDIAYFIDGKFYDKGEISIKPIVMFFDSVEITVNENHFSWIKLIIEGYNFHPYLGNNQTGMIKYKDIFSNYVSLINSISHDYNKDDKTHQLISDIVNQISETKYRNTDILQMVTLLEMLLTHSSKDSDDSITRQLAFKTTLVMREYHKNRFLSYEFNEEFYVQFIRRVYKYRSGLVHGRSKMGNVEKELIALFKKHKKYKDDTDVNTYSVDRLILDDLYEITRIVMKYYFSYDSSLISFMKNN